MILSSATGARYAEHENTNAYRNYPFAEASVPMDDDGVELSADIFVDAMVYPIVEKPCRIGLSELSFPSGRATLACESGEMLSGTAADGAVELYDSLGRHAGTLVCGPGWGREAGACRTRTFSGLWLSSSACCPVVHSGVSSLSDEDATWRTSRRNIVLEGDGNITPVLDVSGRIPELRFDAQYSPAQGSAEGGERRTPVSQIVFAVAGRTLFDIEVDQVDDGVVEVFAPELDREDVCWQAHAEDAVSVVADACESQDSCDTPSIGMRYRSFAVCPADPGSISIVADDAVNYKNPIRISPVKGDASPPRPQIVDGMSREQMFAEAGKLLKRVVTVGNGIMIDMPGLSNGK